MSDTPSVWEGVPSALLGAWRQAFSEAPARIRVAHPCPVCGERRLLRWHDGGRGLWEWCQSCLSYEHSTARAPAGWEPELDIFPVGATAEPIAIASALREAGFI